MDLIREIVLQPGVTADTLKIIRQETAKDPVLAALHTVVMSVWPSKRKGAPKELTVTGEREEI